MESKSLKPVASLSFEVKSTDFAPQIRQLIKEKADVVIMFGANSNLALALKSAKLLNFDANWIAPFFNADPSTRKLAGNALNGVKFSSWLLPVTSENERIKIYREASKAYYPKDPFGIFGLNGWTNAELFVVGMRILLESGNSLTRENFIRAMNSIRDVDIGGTEKVTFKLGDHRGTRQECIIEAMPSGEFEMVRNFEPYPKVVFDQKLV